MTKYKGFNLFDGGPVTDKSGNTFVIRGNTDAENALFRAMIDSLLDNPALSKPFRELSATGDVYLRGMPLNSEFSDYTGTKPNGPAYTSGGAQSHIGGSSGDTILIR
jgi:hypothetical protein